MIGRRSCCDNFKHADDFSWKEKWKKENEKRKWEKKIHHENEVMKCGGYRLVQRWRGSSEPESRVRRTIWQAVISPAHAPYQARANPERFSDRFPLQKESRFDEKQQRPWIYAENICLRVPSKKKLRFESFDASMASCRPTTENRRKVSGLDKHIKWEWFVCRQIG